MNDPFSEVLLREVVLITDRLLALLQVCRWAIPAGLCGLRKVGGSEGGLQDGRGCPEEPWDKTLMLTITGQGARDRGKGPEQMVLEMQRAPGNFILDEESVRYQK